MNAFMNPKDWETAIRNIVLEVNTSTARSNTEILSKVFRMARNTIKNLDGQTDELATLRDKAAAFDEILKAHSEDSFIVNAVGTTLIRVDMQGKLKGYYGTSPLECINQAMKDNSE